MSVSVPGITSRCVYCVVVSICTKLFVCSDLATPAAMCAAGFTDIKGAWDVYLNGWIWCAFPSCLLSHFTFSLIILDVFVGFVVVLVCKVRACLCREVGRMRQQDSGDNDPRVGTRPTTPPWTLKPHTTSHTPTLLPASQPLTSPPPLPLHLELCDLPCSQSTFKTFS